VKAHVLLVLSLDQRQCRDQDGCFWIRWFRLCVGTCTPCDNYQDQQGCEGQLGCSWYPSIRGGNVILKSNSESRVININEVGRVNLQ